MSKNGHVYNFVNYILPFSLGHHGGRHCRVTSNWSWSPFSVFTSLTSLFIRAFECTFPGRGRNIPIYDLPRMQHNYSIALHVSGNATTLVPPVTTLMNPFPKLKGAIKGARFENHEGHYKAKRRLRISIRLVFDPWIKKYISRYLNFFSFLWLLQSHGIHPYCKLLIKLTFRASTK